MPSVFELLFDTYGDHLMQEQAPYDEAEIQAALDRMSMPQDMQIQVCDLLSSRYLRGHGCLCHRPATGPHPGQPVRGPANRYVNCRRTMIPAVTASPSARAR